MKRFLVTFLVLCLLVTQCVSAESLFNFLITPTPEKTDVKAPSYGGMADVVADEVQDYAEHGQAVIYLGVGKDGYNDFIKYLAELEYEVIKSNVTDQKIELIVSNGVYNIGISYTTIEERLILIYDPGVEYETSKKENNPIPKPTGNSTFSPSPIITSNPSPVITFTPSPVRQSCYHCNGSGHCSRCYGSGKCNNCNGLGTKDCDACWGMGGCSSCLGLGYSSSYVKPGEGVQRVTCSRCSGSGRCTLCNGSGNRNCSYCGGTGNCSYCHGNPTCQYCHGTGWLD